MRLVIKSTKVGIYVLLLPAMLCASWSSQTSNTNSNLKNIDFVDARHGWAVGGEYYVQGDAVILHTTDGGTNWVDQTPGGIANGIDGLVGVSFVDTLTGWVIGRDTLQCSLILKTTDAGFTWIRQSLPIDTPTAVSVHFIDKNNGWISHGGPHGFSYQQVILRTTNGGDAWNIQGWDNYDGGTCQIFFADAQHGWAAGGTEMTPTTRGYIMATTDGGNNWIESYHWGASIPATWPLMTAVHFPVDALNGWGCGKLMGATGYNYEIRIVSTGDGGLNWNEVQIINDNSVGTPWDIDMVDLQNGWIVGAGGDILRTTDGFNTWHFDTSGVSTTLRALDFVDINNGWAVGGTGVILKYTGQEGIENIKAARPMIEDINFVSTIMVGGNIVFSISSSKSEIMDFSIYNPLGQRIFSKKIDIPKGVSSQSFSLPQSVSCGVYFLHTTMADKTITRKFILLE